MRAPTHRNHYFRGTTRSDNAYFRVSCPCIMHYAFLLCFSYVFYNSEAKVNALFKICIMRLLLRSDFIPSRRYIGLHRFLFLFCYPFIKAHVQYYLIGVFLYNMISGLSCVRYDLACLLCTISISEPPLLRYLVLGEYRSPST